MHLVIDFVTGQHAPETAMSVFKSRRVGLPGVKQLFVDPFVREQSTSEGMDTVEFRGITVARSHGLLIVIELGSIDPGLAVMHMHRTRFRPSAQPEKDDPYKRTDSC